MKKYLGLFLVAVFLIFPVSATATYIGQADLSLIASSPDNNRWFLDYDATLVTDTDKIFGDDFYGEVFCTEDAPMPTTITTYDFYTIDTGLGSSLYEQLAQATWIANWFITNTDNDYYKGSAQDAIWEAVEIVSGFTATYEAAQSVLTAYKNAGNQDAYVSDWLLAVNGYYDDDGNRTIEIGGGAQNYLVKAPAPVPEPATMLLLGTGLIGLAGLSRKKFKS